MGTQLRVLSESFPMSTNMTGFRGPSKIVASLQVLWAKVASTLEGLTLMLLVANLANTKLGKKPEK